MIKVKLKKRDANSDLQDACSVIQNAWDNLILTIAKDFNLDKFVDWLSKKLSKSKTYCLHECPFKINTCCWICNAANDCKQVCKLNPNECEKRDE